MLVRIGHKPSDWLDLGPSNGSAGPGRIGFRVDPPYRESSPRVDPPKPKPYGGKLNCELTTRCRHAPCVARRVEEARRLFQTTSLTLAQIGQMLGGRDHSTVSYWLREYQDKAA